MVQSLDVITKEKPYFQNAGKPDDRSAHTFYFDNKGKRPKQGIVILNAIMP